MPVSASSRLCSAVAGTTFALTLAACASSVPQDDLSIDSQGKIDVKASMKGKQELFIPIDQIDKLDPEQLKGKKQEIIYGTIPRTRSQGRKALSKGGSKIEVLVPDTMESNSQDVIVSPEGPANQPAPTENKPATDP